MTEQSAVSHATDASRPSVKPIVVAVDGSEHNHSAVFWATHEALRTTRALNIVSAADEYYPPPVPHFSIAYDWFDYQAHAKTVVEKVKSRLQESAPELAVTTHVRSGAATEVILESAEAATLVVVGKRGRHTIARLFLGSTAIAVAGRSPVPVVVVPDTWDQSAHQHDAVVVGVDINRTDAATLEFACQRARDLSVPLIAVHAWELHPALDVSQEDREAWAHEAEVALESVLSPLRTSFPDVEIIGLQRHANPALALLEAAIRAQVLVLGRHSGGERLGGFAFGSVDRAVLHYSECPVVVVPN